MGSVHSRNINYSQGILWTFFQGMLSAVGGMFFIFVVNLLFSSDFVQVNATVPCAGPFDLGPGQKVDLEIAVGLTQLLRASQYL